MKPIEVAVIGTGWCGGIRAETLAAHALVSGLATALPSSAVIAVLAIMGGCAWGCSLPMQASIAATFFSMR